MARSGGLWCSSGFNSSPGGGERMRRKLSEKGKRRGQVHFIGVWTGADMKRLRSAFNHVQNQRFDSFPIEIEFSVASD
jgi:hypothetical protein